MLKYQKFRTTLNSQYSCLDLYGLLAATLKPPRPLVLVAYVTISECIKIHRSSTASPTSTRRFTQSAQIWSGKLNMRTQQPKVNLRCGSRCIKIRF